MPRNAQARMCRRKVIKISYTNTIAYPRIPTYTKPHLSSYSSETLCSIEVTEGLERTGTNHNYVLYKEKSRG
jgi:hypothetical protein